MKKNVWSSVLGLAVLSPSVFAQEEVTDLMQQLDDLSALTVMTPAKKSQKVAETSSVVSIISAKDLETWGVRTLSDALKRIPGFFPSYQPAWSVISSRGIVSQSNDHFLLLVDGHVQNSILGQAFQQQDSIPNLDNVERIEIIRGPGSVLWGSAAVSGIIHVITKKEFNFDHKVSTNYSLEDGMFSKTLQKGIKINDDVYGIMSFTHWSSEGWWDEKRAPHVGQRRFIYNPMADNTKPRMFKQYPSFDIYSKFQLGKNREFIARFLDEANQYYWDSADSSTQSSLRSRKMYVDYRSKSDVNESFNYEFTAFADLLIQNRFPYNFNGTDTRTQQSYYTQLQKRMQDMSDEETALGVEWTGNYQIATQNSIKFGARWVNTEIGPNRDAKFNIEQNRPYYPSLDNTLDTNTYYYTSVKNARDNTVALYGEDTHEISDDKKMFLGVRADYNDFRENKTVFLPRGGFIWNLSDKLTTKYIINTGYLRPMAKYSKSQASIISQGTGQINVAGKSEQILSQDLQVSFTDKYFFLAATAFRMDIKDFLSWDAVSGGGDTGSGSQGYKNMGKAQTTGLELEAKYNTPSNILNVYGNYSYALSKVTNQAFGGTNANAQDALWRGKVTDDKDRFLNYPRHMANLGANINLNERHTVNVNINVLKDMTLSTTSPNWNNGGRITASDYQFQQVDFRGYIDLAYTFKPLKSFDGTVYVNNVNNNTDYLGFSANNGNYRPRGRNLGLRLAYTF